MSDDSTPTQTTVRKRRARISPVWLIPLGAILIGIWLVYQNFISLGPRITLELDNAEGLEAGSTAVMVRNVEVGHVESVRLTEDYAGATAVIQMNPGTEALLVSDSQFWVVKPRVGRHGISGFRTLLSGAYIQLRPGTSENRADRFQVLQHPPVTSGDTPGISITLTGDTASTLNIGDPIVFQGQTVGLVENVEFSAEDNHMRYRVFIEAPYSRVITDATQFWMRSGIDVHIGADGVEVRSGSLQTIFMGGATFGLPEGLEAGEAVSDGANFKLYPSHHAAREDRFTNQIPYLVLLNDSVRGLSSGAPVLYRGIRIGTVTQVPHYIPTYDASLNDYRIPILLAIEPQRIHNWLDWTNKEWRENLRDLFGRGLRATIKPANLLTGAMFISLQFTDETDYEARKVGDYEIIPSTPGAINSIQQQISDLLAKFNNLEIDAMTRDLQKTLQAIEAATESLSQLLGADETGQLAADLSDTLAALQQTLAAYQQGAPMYEELNRSLDNLNRILQRAESLLDTLNEQPNALIFGAENKPDPIPRAAP